MAQSGTQSTHHCKHYYGQQVHKQVVALDRRISAAITEMAITISIIVAHVKQ